MILCGQSAKNGKPCERRSGHSGFHGNSWCPQCGIRPKKNFGWCNKCDNRTRDAAAAARREANRGVHCGKMIKTAAMAESRSCLKTRGHSGRCVPDLAGMRFQDILVLELSAPFKNRTSQNLSTCWLTRNLKNGYEARTRAVDLTSGKMTGHYHGFAVQNGTQTPEYRTVCGHYNHIFISKRPSAAGYKGMPFYDEWNPQKDGAIWKGAKWIIDNLGPKPGPEWSLDIVKHEIGFMPGNLRWATRNTQALNKQHRTLGQWTNEEFDVEAHRRGYVKEK